MHYVDSVIRSRKHPKNLTMLNSYHPNIKFTCELESNSSLPFLDVLLTRNDDGHLARTVCRKSMHSKRYLDFLSFHRLSQKIGVARTLFTRARRICDPISINSELDEISSRLVANSYPPEFIRIQLHLSPLAAGGNISKDGKWFALPFIRPVSYPVAKILRSKLSINLGFHTGINLQKLLGNF